MSIIQGNTKVSAGGYNIDQSIRFNDNDSPSLRRTPSATSSRTTATVSVWFKWNPTRFMNILTWGTSGNNYGFLRLGDNGSYGYGYTLGDATGGSFNWLKRGTILFRDPSAWYHYVAVIDTTDATAEDRVKLYINGTQITNFSSYNVNPSLNYQNQFNLISTPMDVGRDPYNGTYADGYMAEYHWIDGQQLAPTDFGEYNADGVWIPKQYAGTYGNNGFYLKGQDSAALGDDSSGNGNDFTASGLTSDDQVSDSPTLNFPVISPIDRQSGSAATISDGNLTFTNGNTGTSVDARATFALPKGQGKWYFEMEADILGQSGVNREFMGIVSTEWRIDSGGGGDAFWVSPDGFSFSTAGSKGNNGSLTSYGSAWSAGDIIGCAVDLDNNKIWWSINNTWQASGDPAAGTNAAFTSLSSDVTYAPAFAVDYGTGTSQIIANFGQTGGLTYTPPTGFSQIDSSTLPTPTIADGSAYFQTTLYSGNGSTQEINQSGNSVFQPSWVWIKERNGTRVHSVYDEVRGVQKYLQTSAVDAESTSSLSLTSFDADGFTLGSGPWVNNSGNTYVAWQWLAGNGTASNTDGSITSTVSVNTTAGFSIATYTGTGSAATIGHGLGVAPSFIVVKKRVAGTDDAWIIWHQDLPGPNYYLNFDTGAQDTSVNYWNNTLPTSSVFSVGASNGTNQSTKTFVAYLWNEVEGFSKFGSYIGNGSTNGPFVWCGFRPAYVITKNATSAGDAWPIADSARSTYNVANATVFANQTTAETTGYQIDMLSNGFKVRSVDHGVNESAATLIFMAFAEHPFGGDGVAPVPAR